MFVFFDGIWHHAVRPGDPPGTALCGYPPRKPDGSRWARSDPLAVDADLFTEAQPPVTCRWCRAHLSDDHPFRKGVFDD